MHGGLFWEDITLEKIQMENRLHEIVPKNSLVEQMLWSDPDIKVLFVYLFAIVRIARDCHLFLLFYHIDCTTDQRARGEPTRSCACVWQRCGRAIPQVSFAFFVFVFVLHLASTHNYFFSPLNFTVNSITNYQG